MAKKSLEERIERLEAVHEIQNLMGRYSYYHTADMQEETVALWAKKTPGVVSNVPSFGLYKGIGGVRRLYVGAHQVFGEKGRIGAMHMHTLTTPVIEVAGDGKTAKGVWISLGHETAKAGDKLQANWAWLKYGIDFVKEDGQWKIWHFHVYGIFHCPYETSWVEMEKPSYVVDPNASLPDWAKADRPVTHPVWMYSPTAVTENVPEPPEPYETWDESMSYVE